MTMARFGLEATSPAAADVSLQFQRKADVPSGRNASLIATAGALVLSDVIAFGIVSVVIASILIWLGVFPSPWIVQNSTVLRDIGAVLGTGVFGVTAYLAVNGHYTRRLSFSSEIRLLACSGIFALGLSSISAALVPELHAYLGLATVWMFFPVLALCGRKLVRGALKRAGVSQVRMILVGHSNAVSRVLPSLTASAGFDGEVVAVVDPNADLNDLPSSVNWRLMLQQCRANLVVVCDDVPGSVALEVASSLAEEGVPFAVAAYTEELQPSAFQRVDLFGSDVTLLSYRNQTATPAGRVSKIVVDLLIASVCVVALLPLLLIIVALVKSDGGPLLFGHTRLGLGGRPFRCLKFRSMVVDSEAVLKRLLETSPQARAEWAETQKLRHDPRVTTVGRFLRASSLDELPQLLNVLRLEMSLVGPRPIVSAEVPRYGENIKYYYQTRPGLTGLWQISGRSSTGYKQRVEFDRCYVRNWTIWQDVAILAKTVPAVLKRRGAY